MKYQPLPISNAYRRFVALSRKVRRLLEQGKFQKLSVQQQQQLAGKLRDLYQRLSSVFSKGRLRRILASAALVIGLGATAQSQEFAPIVRNPFGLGFSPYIPLVTFADLDDDGDQDLIALQYSGNNGQSFVYFENTGDAQSPAFAAPQINPFGLSTIEYLTTPFLVDIDDDGDQDLFAGSYYFNGALGTLLYFENEGTAESPSFAPEQLNPFGVEPSLYQLVPVFVDLDNDGDFDLLGTNYNYDTERIEFRYQENSGSADAPQFSPAVNSPFGLVNNALYAVLPTVGDLDMDGDYDVLAGGSVYDTGPTTILEYQENTGTPESPAFGALITNPFGISFPNTAYLTVPALVDIDDDGDLDLFVGGNDYDPAGGEYESVLWFFENTTVINNTKEPTPVAELKLFPTLTESWLNWQLGLPKTPPSLRLEAFAADGRRVRSWKVEGQQQGQLDVGQLPAGLYQLRLSDGAGQLLARERFVVR